MKCDYVNLGNIILGYRYLNLCQLFREGIFGIVIIIIMFFLGMVILIYFCYIEKIDCLVVDGRVSVVNVFDYL